LRNNLKDFGFGFREIQRPEVRAAEAGKMIFCTVEIALCYLLIYFFIINLNYTVNCLNE